MILQNTLERLILADSWLRDDSVSFITDNSITMHLYHKYNRDLMISIQCDINKKRFFIYVLMSGIVFKNSDLEKIDIECAHYLLKTRFPRFEQMRHINPILFN